ncbi:hypothetical protein, partial [Blautia wexlerae]|uniref:hypothetical protein n=1 Tax=Blautia wexlerae TaxID=418240 RepID=UPI001A9B7FEE
NECTADFRIGVPFEQNLHKHVLRLLQMIFGILDMIARTNIFFSAIVFPSKVPFYNIPAVKKGLPG